MSTMKALTMSENLPMYESAYKCEQPVNKLCTNWSSENNSVMHQIVYTISLKHDTRVTVTVIMSCLQPTPNMI